MSIEQLEFKNQGNAYQGLSTDTKSVVCPFGSTFFETDTGNKYEFTNGGWIGITLDTRKQDQHTPPIFLKFNQITGQSQLTSATVIDTRVFNVVDGTEFEVGESFSIVNALGKRFFAAKIVSISSNEITVASLIDFEYQIDDYCNSRKTNMAVDGSVAPQKFSIRGAIEQEVPVSLDITRTIWGALCDKAVDLKKFIDIPALTNGVLVRKINRVTGQTLNYFTLRSNYDFDLHTLDWVPYLSTNPQQGTNGMTCRLTFNGDDKCGVTIRLNEYDDLEMIVQDDLTVLTQSIELFENLIEGHIVS